MFSPDDIEWRIQRAGFSGDKPWAMVVPYITARAVQERFDEVFGMFGWEVEFKDILSGNQIIGCEAAISVWFGENKITKWDASENTNIEAIKGGRSSAMKRCAVQWGVGRYLYQMDTVFAECRQCVDMRDKHYGNIHVVKSKGGPDKYIDWAFPPLPAWALPQIDFSKYFEAVRAAETKEALASALAQAIKAIKSAQDTEARQELQRLRQIKLKELDGKRDLSKQKHQVSLELQAKDYARVIHGMPSITTLDNAFKKHCGILASSAEKLDVSPSSSIEYLKSEYTKRRDLLLTKEG
ncbi:hypothetical protein A1OU_06905 [Enterovibrio norvegicus]|nr:hypothetical protein A1OU_06905 [Enterovibrio norvegicus]